MSDNPYATLEPGHRVVNNAQRLYLVYSWGVLIDLVVINICDEFWDLISIPSFTISLMVAIVLQAGLALCIESEKRAAAYFMKKPGKSAKIMRAITSYLIIAGGKFAIMGAIYLIFSDRVEFLGPFGGAVAFVGLVAAVLIAEWLSKRVFVALDKSKS